MSHKNVIRAWKDKKYRLSLSETELAQLPPHPAGAVELTNADLGVVSGSAISQFCTFHVCTVFCPTQNLVCPTKLCTTNLTGC